MMMIGPLIMGTISSSGSEASAGSSGTPNPIYIDTNWWSFTREDREAAPSVGIVSRKSVNSGLNWTVENTTYHTAFAVNTSVFGGGIIGGVGGSFVNHKSIASPTADWIFTDVGTIAGGYVGGGINLLSYDTNGSQFILNKQFGEDLYTSTDLVTYTPVNGVTINALAAELDRAYDILYVGAQYVAYGIKTLGSPDIFGSATSTDLLAWTDSAVVAPQFFHLAFFAGIYIGVNIEAMNVKTDTVKIYTSTDFINWTRATLPNSGPGSSFELVTIQGGGYTLFSNSQMWSTTNGTTFVEEALNFNLITPSATPHGKIDPLASGNPDRILMDTIDIEEFGGKIIKWPVLLADAPILTYPVGQTSGAVVGLVGTSAKLGAGITGNGFEIVNTTGKQGFYFNNSDLRYFEYTIIANGAFDIGIDVPQERYFSGLSTFDVRLSSLGKIITSSGDLTVSYTPAIGQVIGFLINFITLEITIKVDNVDLITIPSIASSVLWTQIMNCITAQVKMNIGQDSFIYTQAGALAWGDPYV